MTGRDIYEVWAPASDEWSPWVKPVLFTEIDEVITASISNWLPEESRLGLTSSGKRAIARAPFVCLALISAGTV